MTEKEVKEVINSEKLQEMIDNYPNMTAFVINYKDSEGNKKEFSIRQKEARFLEEYFASFNSQYMVRYHKLKPCNREELIKYVKVILTKPFGDNHLNYILDCNIKDREKQFHYDDIGYRYLQQYVSDLEEAQETEIWDTYVSLPIVFPVSISQQDEIGIFVFLFHEIKDADKYEGIVKYNGETHNGEHTTKRFEISKVYRFLPYHDGENEEVLSNYELKVYSIDLSAYTKTWLNIEEFWDEPCTSGFGTELGIIEYYNTIQKIIHDWLNSGYYSPYDMYNAIKRLEENNDNAHFVPIYREFLRYLREGKKYKTVDKVIKKKGVEKWSENWIRELLQRETYLTPYGENPYDFSNSSVYMNIEYDMDAKEKKEIESIIEAESNLFGYLF